MKLSELNEAGLGILDTFIDDDPKEGEHWYVTRKGKSAKWMIFRVQNGNVTLAPIDRETGAAGEDQLEDIPLRDFHAHFDKV